MFLILCILIILLIFNWTFILSYTRNTRRFNFRVVLFLFISSNNKRLHVLVVELLNMSHLILVPTTSLKFITLLLQGIRVLLKRKNPIIVRPRTSSFSSPLDLIVSCHHHELHRLHIFLNLSFLYDKFI